MCGICGIIKSDNDAEVDPTVLQSMRVSMVHLLILIFERDC